MLYIWQVPMNIVGGPIWWEALGLGPPKPGADLRTLYAFSILV